MHLSMSELVRNQIEELAEIIREQTQKLLAYEQGAPQIEVDITKENLRKLYTLLESLVNDAWQTPEKNISALVDEQVDELLNTAEEQFGEAHEEIKQQIQEQHEIIEEQNEEQEEEIELDEEHIEPEPAKIEKDEVKVEPKQSIKEVKKVAEHIPENQSAVKTEKTEAPNNIEPEIKFEEKPEEESQKAEEQAASKNETAAGEAQSIGDHLQKKPIKSLKSAIGINDKFQFINELFDGKMKSYNEAIDALEQAASGNEAIELFHKMANEHDWDMENPAYEQLLNYVERRFL
jgi:predicted phage tail protein